MTTVEPPRGFAADEFETRLARAQGLMRRSGLKGLLLTREPEVRYFSGFMTQFWQSPTRPWFLLIPLEGKPVAVIPEIGVAAMRRTWLDDIRSWPAPIPEDDGVSLLAETMRDLGLDSGRVGVLMGPETLLRMPLADYQRLKQALPAAAFVDATALVRSLRMLKSEAEIAKIAHICGIASQAFSAVPGLAYESKPLADVFRAFKIDLLTRGSDDVPYLVGGAAQGGYADVISPPNDAPLRSGDVLMMDVGAVYDGYFCDFDRNYAIGVAVEAAQRAYNTLYRATDAGLAAARPGATCADLSCSMQAVIEADGYDASQVGRMGHGLGMQLTEWPSLIPTDRTILEPGMVLTLEPSLSVTPEYGMVHEENLVIREGGFELLSHRAPSEIPVVT